MTLRQISTMIEVPLRTLQRWWKDGRFSGGPLFELEHVKRAAETVGREVSSV
jgi:predicted site-specific integrase-resolvase